MMVIIIDGLVPIVTVPFNVIFCRYSTYSTTVQVLPKVFGAGSTWNVNRPVSTALLPDPGCACCLACCGLLRCGWGCGCLTENSLLTLPMLVWSNRVAGETHPFAYLLGRLYL